MQNNKYGFELAPHSTSAIPLIDSFSVSSASEFVRSIRNFDPPTRVMYNLPLCLILKSLLLLSKLKKLSLPETGRRFVTSITQAIITYA